MMEVVQADAVAVLGKEYVNVTIDGITVELAFDVVSETDVAVAKRDSLVAKIIVESARKAQHAVPSISFMSETKSDL